MTSRRDLSAPLAPTDTARWVLPVLVPLGAVSALHAAMAPTALPALARSLGHAALWGGALTAGLVLLMAVGRRWRRTRGLASHEAALATVVVAVFVMLTAFSTRFPLLPTLEPMARNWQGKVLDLLWVGILCALLHRWARSEAGLRWRLVPGSLRPALLTVGAVFLLFVALGAIAAAVGEVGARPVDAGQLLWDATLPNLTEELIWRGAMLAVLDRALPPRRRVLGAPMGGGAVITSVVFALGHLLLPGADGNWSLSPGGGVFALVMGLAMAWIRARTGSIWPAFALHCAPELGADLGVLSAT